MRQDAGSTSPHVFFIEALIPPVLPLTGQRLGVVETMCEATQLVSHSQAPTSSAASEAGVPTWSAGCPHGPALVEGCEDRGSSQVGDRNRLET